MIGRGEITKAAQADEVDAATAERDYVLAHLALSIAEVSTSSLVLKGGTCLRLAHYENYRYSADLDYSLIGVTKDQAHERIVQAATRCRDRVGLSLLDVDGDEITYVGPLGAKPRRIKLDLADDELVVEHAESHLVATWRDLPETGVVSCYSLTEVCAEKLRCVVQRRQCRDVYDLWSLLDDRGGTDLLEAWHRFAQKAEHKGISPLRFFDRWHEGADWYRRRWEDELGDYIGNTLPDVSAVLRSLDRKVAEVERYLGR